MTIDVSLIPQNRVENLISKLSEIENNIGNIGTDITNNVVHKNGNETITGEKTFTSYTHFTSSEPKLVFKSSVMDITQSGWTAGRNSIAWCEDKNGYESGGIYNNISNDYKVVTSLYAMSRKSGKQQSSFIRVGVDDLGNAFTEAPTPSSSDSSSKIATTAWVNNLDNSVVHKAGDESINGTKTFNNEIIFNAIPVFNGGKNDSTEGGEIHIASTPNKGWDKYTIIDEQDGGIRFFNFKNNQVYGYRFDLNEGKGLPKARMVVDAYSSGTSWYRVWSDGWIEQGGQYGSWSNNPQLTISLNKAFTQTNYAVSVFSFGTIQDAYTGQLSFVSRTTSSFVVNTYTNGRDGISWIAMGY